MGQARARWPHWNRSAEGTGRRWEGSTHAPRAIPASSTARLPRYREAGIEEIWIVDPFRRELRWELRTAQDYECKTLAPGRLASRVIPGFGIDVEWLWQKALPSTMDCLRALGIMA